MSKRPISPDHDNQHHKRARQTKRGTRNNDHHQPAVPSHDERTIENVYPNERRWGDEYGPMHPERRARMENVASSASQFRTGACKNAEDTATSEQIPKASTHDNNNFPKRPNPSARAPESGRSEDHPQNKSSPKPGGASNRSRARPDADPSSAKPKPRKRNGPKKYPREDASTSPDAHQPSSGRGSESNPPQIPRHTPRAPPLSEKGVTTYGETVNHVPGPRNRHNPYLKITPKSRQERDRLRNLISSSAGETIYWAIDMLPHVDNRPDHFPDHVLDVSRTWLEPFAELLRIAKGDFKRAFESIGDAVEKRCKKRRGQMCSDDVKEAIGLHREKIGAAKAKAAQPDHAKSWDERTSPEQNDGHESPQRSTSQDEEAEDEEMKDAPGQTEAQDSHQDAEQPSPSSTPAPSSQSADPMDIDLADAIATPLPPSPKPANASASLDQPPP